MAKEISKDDFVNIGDPRIRYPTMEADVELLYQKGRYVSCAWLILSCIDAIAAEPGEALRRKFARFVESEFPELCSQLSKKISGKSGAEVLYDQFRNGLAHLFAPKSGFALARDHELDGAYAGDFDVDGPGTVVGINIDRFSKDFVSMARRKGVEAR